MCNKGCIDAKIYGTTLSVCFIYSIFYYIFKNQEYNYSNNPSFVSDGTDGKQAGTIRFNQFFTNAYMSGILIFKKFLRFYFR